MKKTDRPAYESALKTVLEGISLANRMNNRPRMIPLNHIRDDLLFEPSPNGKSTPKKS